MNNILTITNQKQNTIEFNAGLDGLNGSDMTIRFIIEAAGMDFGFDAKRIKDSLWEVVIPPLSMLEKTAYNFRIDVVSEGYFFAPIRGVVNVVGTHELYITDPTNKNIPPNKITQLAKTNKVSWGSDTLSTKQDTVGPAIAPNEPSLRTAKSKSVNTITNSMAKLRALIPDNEQHIPKEGIYRTQSTKPKRIKQLVVKGNNDDDTPPADNVTNIIKQAEKRIIDSHAKKEDINNTPIVELPDFTLALEALSKPPKKKHMSTKVPHKLKAGTIKRITTDKKIISKPKQEVWVETKNEQKVKDILAHPNEHNKTNTTSQQ